MRAIVAFNIVQCVVMVTDQVCDTAVLTINWRDRAHVNVALEISEVANPN
mgnify:CR=1 FL=1|jgi:hypothetical protein